MHGHETMDIMDSKCPWRKAAVSTQRRVSYYYLLLVGNPPPIYFLIILSEFTPFSTPYLDWTAGTPVASFARARQAQMFRRSADRTRSRHDASFVWHLNRKHGKTGGLGLRTVYSYLPTPSRTCSWDRRTVLPSKGYSALLDP